MIQLIRIQKNGKLKLFSMLIACATLLVGQVAGADDDDSDEEIPFDEAEVFFELNNTDGDLGIHSKIDGGPWRRLEIEDPGERRMLKIRVRGRLRRQGLTELFFESAEPTFDELSPEDFFARFPEGEYEVEGLSLEGEELESETEVTHVMPAPPQPSVNGIAFVEDCDEGELPEVSAPVTISWEEVTDSHPDLGRSGEAIEVVNYEVVVEIDDTPWVAHAILPPEARSYRVPDEILAQAEDGEVKYEVLVREGSYNQTATESCFALE